MSLGGDLEHGPGSPFTSSLKIGGGGGKRIPRCWPALPGGDMGLREAGPLECPGLGGGGGGG